MGAGPAQVIQPDQMQKGFFNIVSAVEDLQIDVPEAPDLVANFVARAVVDDILPPAVVDRLPSGAFAGVEPQNCQPALLPSTTPGSCTRSDASPTAPAGQRQGRARRRLIGRRLQASLTGDVCCWTGDSTDSAVGLVKHKAEKLLRSRHAGERMLRCWGSGAGLAFEDTREAIKKLLSVRHGLP